jgi:serine/threonine protein kinase
VNSERIIELFNEAAERLPEEREAFLAASCRDQPELRQHLERLLRAGQAAAGNFLNQAASGAMRAPALVTQKPGDKIGHYKLLQQIGEGGCGMVYMAEQEEPVRRMVALKVIKLGMDTKQVIARFEAERQALALMDHPNIAKVLEAGATDTGRPYFVMELVRGIKITDYCDKNNLPTRERLDLFVQICQAVQHAHQKGVIHRDLKPSNILVTLRDGIPVPKVIDFGIAKATTDQRLTDKTLFTAFEQFIGTPAYMSPEQAEMSELGIDTRSDIYSLGVLLYELLTGTTPFASKALLQSGLEEIRRIIREVEPVKPSTRLTQEFISESKINSDKSRAGIQKSKIDGAASSRLLRIKEIIPLLRGDLDWIVMKALEKDRARRYETANGLAMDVQRYLSNEPVVARPPSKLYRFQKMARRNKLAFAAASAVAAALMIGLAASTREYVKVVAAEKQARAINRFLTEEVLGQATPEKNARAKNVTVIEALNAATHMLDESAEYRQQPRLEASLRLAVGRTYYDLSLLSEAERNLRRAVKLGRSALGPQHLDTLAAQHWLAKLLISQRKWNEGEGLIRETWQGRQRLLGVEDLDTLDSQELYEEALLQGGQLQEVETIARHILQIRERIQGPGNEDTINSLLNLGMALEVRGVYPEAERYIREALARFQRIGSALVPFCVKELALVRFLQGDSAEAEKLLKEVLPGAKRMLGPDSRVTLHIQRVLVRTLAEEGRLDEAESLGKETLSALLRTQADQEDAGLGRTRLSLGRVLVEKGKLDEAEPLLEKALTLLRQQAMSTPKPELPAQAENWLGAIQLARKAYPEAEALLLPGAECFFAAKAEMSPNERRVAVGHIVKLYEAWGKPEKAAAWKRRLDELADPKANSPR